MEITDFRTWTEVKANLIEVERKEATHIEHYELSPFTLNAGDLAIGSD